MRRRGQYSIWVAQSSSACNGAIDGELASIFAGCADLKFNSDRMSKRIEHLSRGLSVLGSLTNKSLKSA
jgi:hypothetical protein